MKVTQESDHFIISFDDGTPFTYHFIWLRDSCGCENCTHPTSQQKLRSSATINLDVAPVSFNVDEDKGILNVSWNDSHNSKYNSSWLQNYSYTDESTEKRKQQIKPSLWTADQINEKHSVDFNSFMNDDEALIRCLRTFLDYGLLFITDVPTTNTDNHFEAGVAKVATRIGPIRETFYGRTWDVKNIPNSHSLAYTAVDLGLHQDLTYFESTPPVQLLHCIKQSNNGGENAFIDSYLAAERLKQKFPHHFETLLRVPMTFRLTNNGHNFYRQKPILYENSNLYIGVTFGPQNHGPLNVPPKDVKPWYAAFSEFSKCIYSEDMVLTRKLKEGELVMFDNRRVLHGRALFDPSEARLLKGTYLGMDEVEDRYNILIKKKNLPSGFANADIKTSMN